MVIKPEELRDTGKEARSAAVLRARELEAEIDAVLRDATLTAGMYQVHVRGRDAVDNPYVRAEIERIYGPHWRVNVVGPCNFERRDAEGELIRGENGDPLLDPATQFYFIPQNV